MKNPHDECGRGERPVGTTMMNLAINTTNTTAAAKNLFRNAFELFGNTTEAKYYSIEGLKQVLRFFNLEPGWMEDIAANRLEREYGFNAMFEFKIAYGKVIDYIVGLQLSRSISLDDIERELRLAISVIEECC